MDILIAMGWILRIFALVTSWTRIKSTVQQTKAGAEQASNLATGIQQKHTQESYERALAGDLAATYDLGERYYDGRGLARDYRAAAEWFAKAAEGGHAKAQSNLGLMFLLGRGVPKDLKTAKRYLIEAAENGDEMAIETLEKMRLREQKNKQA